MRLIHRLLVMAPIVPMWSGVGIHDMQLLNELLVMPLVFPVGSHSECLRETSAQNISNP